MFGISAQTPTFFKKSFSLGGGEVRAYYCCNFLHSRVRIIFTWSFILLSLLCASYLFLPCKKQTFPAADAAERQRLL